MDQPNSNSKDVAVYEPQERALALREKTFEFDQRQAKALAMSDLVPAAYKGNVANCMLAIDVANQVGERPLTVMQNLNVIHGKPGWSGKYVIAKLHSCGRFSDVCFIYQGSGDTRSCRVVAKNRQTGASIEGPIVDVKMAKAEGWYDKNPKWRNLTDMMLGYRSGSFFGNLYCPDVLFGMDDAEDMRDVTPESATKPDGGKTADIADVNKRIRERKATKKPPVVIEAEAVETTGSVTLEPDREGGFF
jgi:hypothetical protein